MNYKDQRDFSPSPPQHTFKQNNVIADDGDDDDGYELGDETIQQNIDRNIQMFEAEDLEIDAIDKADLPPPAKSNKKGKGRGRGRKHNVTCDEKGNECNETVHNWHYTVDGLTPWTVPDLQQASRCDNYSDIVNEMRTGDDCDKNLVGLLDTLIADSLYTDNAEQVKGTADNEAVPPGTDDKSSDESVQKLSDESVQVLEVIQRAPDSNVKNDVQGDLAVINMSTGETIDTTGLEYVGVVDVPQAQTVITNNIASQPHLVTLDNMKSVLIVDNGHAANDYFLISHGMQQEFMSKGATNLGVVNTTTTSVTNAGVNETGIFETNEAITVRENDIDSKKEKAGNGDNKGETVYTLKAVVESETNESASDDNPPHSADDFVKLKKEKKKQFH